MIAPGPLVADTTSIPVAGRGLTGEQVGAALEGLGDDVRIDASAQAPRSIDMDPATASLVVGLATAVPQLIAAVAAAWGRHRKRGDAPSSAPATVVVETAGAEIVVHVGADGALTGEDSRPLDEASLPASPRQIVRIHLR